MKYSGIGGQAVIEGVMMKNLEKYAVAVRKPDGEIDVQVKNTKPLFANEKLRKIPIVRGVVSFLDSLVTGMETLEHSASFFEDEDKDADKKPKTETEKKKAKRKEKATMAGTLILSLILALGIFFFLPYGLSLLLYKSTDNYMIIAAAEGILRFAIFILYVWLISYMEDIKRTYMYHGAEHKCINCIEAGRPLDIANVRISSRFHKRCGTSFLLFVVIISIVCFMFIRVDNRLYQLLLRLVLIPVIAGLSYEFIRFAGRGDNIFVKIVSAPGMWLQRLTTKEPTDDMIEVGIASVEAVFDWRKYLKDEYNVVVPVVNNMKTSCVKANLGELNLDQVNSYEDIG